MRYKHTKFGNPPIEAECKQSQRVLFLYQYEESARSISSLILPKKHDRFRSFIYTLYALSLSFSPGTDDRGACSIEQDTAHGPWRRNKTHVTCWEAARIYDNQFSVYF